MDSQGPLPLPSPYLMIVQRDDEERYQLLLNLFQGKRVEVVRDRRVGDRRGSAAGQPTTGHQNRRSGERRAPLPDRWVNLGFFVARRNGNSAKAAPELESQATAEPVPEAEK